MMENQLLTVKEAAAKLGVVTSRIRTLLIEGKLKGEHYGRDWMIRAEDLREFEKTYKPTTGRPRSGGGASSQTKQKPRKSKKGSSGV